MNLEFLCVLKIWIQSQVEFTLHSKTQRYNTTDLCWCQEKSCKCHRTELWLIWDPFIEFWKFQGKIIVLRIRILLTPWCKTAAYSHSSDDDDWIYNFIFQTRMFIKHLASLFQIDLICKNIFHLFFISWLRTYFFTSSFGNFHFDSRYKWRNNLPVENLINLI